MCKATKCYCVDCKRIYWEVDESICWRRYAPDSIEYECWNISLSDVEELKEWSDCAQCMGHEETRALRLSRLIGLRTTNDNGTSAAIACNGRGVAQLDFSPNLADTELTILHCQTGSGDKAEHPEHHSIQRSEEIQVVKAPYFRSALKRSITSGVKKKVTFEEVEKSHDDAVGTSVRRKLISTWKMLRGHFTQH